MSPALLPVALWYVVSGFAEDALRQRSRPVYLAVGLTYVLWRTFK
jgi:hypothetical protein